METLKIWWRELQILLQKAKEYLKKHKGSITTAALMSILMHIVIDTLIVLGVTALVV